MTDHEFELRLRADFRELAEPGSAGLRASVIRIPEQAPSSLGHGPTAGWRVPAVLRFAPLAMAATAVLVAVLIGVGLLVRHPEIGPSPGPVTPSEPPASASPGAATCPANPSGPPVGPERLTDPLHPSSANVISRRTLQDESDSAIAYVDIGQVEVDGYRPNAQHYWGVGLAAGPPSSSHLDPALHGCTVLAYGLTFDTTGDGEADYVVGVSNEKGARRGWVTDLATGETRSGSPGFPVEWAGPCRQCRNQRMVFTFLGSSAPEGVDNGTPFYAWASVERNGELLAWDYAPDEGWLDPR